MKPAAASWAGAIAWSRRMIEAARLDIDVNLQSFSQFLVQQGIAHRINEESGQQVIRVGTPGQARLVQLALRQWQTGELPLPEKQAEGRLSAASIVDLRRNAWALLGAMRAAPVTAVLSLACIGVALLSGLGAQADRLAFLFYPDLPAGSLFSLLGGIDSVSQGLRTLTPMFLHFGALHIIFNLLWLWYFGRQLERIQSSWIFLLVVLVTSFSGNTAQYLVTAQSNFGGMSGVVYGLVGYAWILHNFVPRQRLMLNNSMFVVFVVVMVLMELFASSWIASAAHAGGLVSGLMCGAIYAAGRRLLPRR